MKHRVINWEAVEKIWRNSRSYFYFNEDRKENRRIFEDFKPNLWKIARKNEKQNPIFLKNITAQTGMKDGSRERYRELVRIRDNRTCQECHKKWKKGSRRLDVHHIDGTPEDTMKCDKNFNNQITLCHRCHLRIEGIKMLRVKKIIN